MLRILITSDFYLPDYKSGGPVKSVSGLCNSLQYFFEITVMTRNHGFGLNEPYQNIVADKKIMLDNYNVIYLSRIDVFRVLNCINMVKPDIIYLNSFFSKFSQLILLLSRLGLISSKIVLAPRGELSCGALSIKLNKKKFFIQAMKSFGLHRNITFHTTDASESADVSKIFDNNLFQIPNLTTGNNQVKAQNKKNLNTLKIVFLSRISLKKNLVFALQTLKSLDVGEVIFDIYGTKEDLTYWKQCELVIGDIKTVKVNFKGAIIPTDVTGILSQYHLFFLPTLSENFGHAIVEAMQAGVPVLISDQTPWNDVQKYDAGWALNLADKNSFLDVTHTMLKLDNKAFQEKSKNVKKYISSKLNNETNIEMYKNKFTEVV
jgi:glycosyltransferase involved in cell wall biosynthesis